MKWSVIVEWATIAGAAVGGAIAIAGDLIGQISARKQAAKQRRETLEDAQRIREQTREDEHLKGLQQRERQAEEKIVASILSKRVSIVAPLGDELNQQEITKRALDIGIELYIESVHILDSELRKRLETCGMILDMATTPTADLNKRPLNEIVVIVRNNIFLWLGASLRGQVIPPPSEEWVNLVSGLDDAVSQWKSWLKQSGYEFGTFSVSWSPSVE